MAQASRARSLAPHEPGFERFEVVDPKQSPASAALAATIRADGLAIASRALSPSQSAGASRESKAAASACDWAAGSAADDGGKWVKVGARE